MQRQPLHTVRRKQHSLVPKRVEFGRNAGLLWGRSEGVVLAESVPVLSPALLLGLMLFFAPLLEGGKSSAFPVDNVFLELASARDFVSALLPFTGEEAFTADTADSCFVLRVEVEGSSSTFGGDEDGARAATLPPGEV